MPEIYHPGTIAEAFVKLTKFLEEEGLPDWVGKIRVERPRRFTDGRVWHHLHTLSNYQGDE